MPQILRFLFFLSALVGLSLSSPINSRIVGGEVVDISKHPYVVSIRIKSCATCPFVHKCGGSIYSEKVVITAAQCLLNLDSKWSIMVVAGANSRSGADGVQMPVGKNITHSGYNFWTIENDIGLVFLKDALPLNDVDIKTIAIAKSAPLAGKSAIVSGWGWDAEDGASTFFLHDAVLSVVSNADCEKAYGAGEVTTNMVCAGVEKGGKDGCQEDSGGPLVVDGELVGLVSWGRGCGRKGFPSVFTNVRLYKEWIDEKITEMS